jgi:hypothetical protein
MSTVATSSSSSSSAGSGNYLKNVFDAIMKCVSSGSNQQVADSGTALLCVNMQRSVNAKWLVEFDKKTADVNFYAELLAKDPKNKDADKWRNSLLKAQASLQEVQTKMQTYSNQTDAATQSANSAVNQGSIQMSQRLQLVQAILQLARAVSEAIARN